MSKVAVFSSKPYWVEWFNKVNKSGISFTFFNMALCKISAKTTKGFDAVCCFVNDKLDKEVLEELKNCGIKLVLLRCAGMNTLDNQAAKDFGITVLRVPSYSPYAVAEFTLALILGLNRKTHKAYNRTREGNFEISGLLGFDMKSKTVGVVGTGKIGLEVCRILRGFQCNIIAYDVIQNKEALELGVKYVTLDEIWKTSDVITLHTPLLKETKYIICENSINQMKKGVMLINVSRGALINSKDVIQGLKTGHIGYLGIDVYEEESNYFFEDFSANGIQDDVLSRLTSFPNVMVTSHQAWYTMEAISEICNVTINNLLDFQTNTLKSINIVIPPPSS
ncbi:D-lactate dehydrogenase [Tieghemostelium lacteum]|uniref:D-lactate dehydrogenase n=1 Tax=Tieghemostelium lacteum TaxID=361077 RepID=A0A151Z8E7_TIELA|nr:D-lactate dehydrogenase [Tieghemostelium lacteum]|eukprot:KYQ90074.1 D-lactate dehydrogenase [Tieghemostelium lacteum]